MNSYVETNQDKHQYTHTYIEESEIRVGILVEFIIYTYELINL